MHADRASRRLKHIAELWKALGRPMLRQASQAELPVLPATPVKTSMKKIDDCRQMARLDQAAGHPAGGGLRRLDALNHRHGIPPFKPPSGPSVPGA